MLGTAKLRHRNSISWPTMRGRGVSIHDHFKRDSTYRDSQLKIGWTEEKCIGMGKFAQEGHSYCQSCEEYERCR